MISKNKQALYTPVIGKVIVLNKYIFEKRVLLNKSVRNVYGQSLLSQCNVLFTLAMREVRGKDCYKRAHETIEDIQAMSYLIHSLNAGWNMKVTSTIDMLCDEISEHLYKVNASRNAGSDKSKDDVGRA